MCGESKYLTKIGPYIVVLMVEHPVRYFFILSFLFLGVFGGTMDESWFQITDD